MQRLQVLVKQIPTKVADATISAKPTAADDGPVVRFIGAPFAQGQNLGGTEVAPQAMRDAGFKAMAERIGWHVADNGDCTYEGDDLETKHRRLNAFRKWLSADTEQSYQEHSREVIRSPDSVHVKKSKVLDPYADVKNVDVIAHGCHAVYREVLDAAQGGQFALTIGGDHSIASATIAATLQAYPDLAVVWVDAHADANTPDTSPSNHYHGMPAAHLMGWFKKPLPAFEWLQSVLQEGRLAYVGLRDIDPEEGRMLQASGAHVFTMAQVDRLGIAQVMALAIEKVDPYHRRPLHLSFDIDAIDPVFAPGTGTLARGGLTYRESHYICEELSATNRLVAMDLVEVNPLVDQRPRQAMHCDDPDLAPTTITVSFALELCFSSLGKNILNQAPTDHAILGKQKRGPKKAQAGKVVLQQPADSRR